MSFKNFWAIIKDKKNKKILIAIACLLVLVVALNLFDSNAAAKKSASGERTVVNESFDDESYEAKLEKKIVAILSQIEGVGKADALVMVEAGGEYEYATEAKSKSERSKETTTGEKETESSYDERDESYLVIKNSSGDEYPVLIKKTQPAIKGILIVCQGGDDPKIRLTIIEAMKAAFDISANKVYVAKK